MCGLCGLFGSDDHWSASIPGSSNGGVASPASADPVQRRRARNHRVDLTNKMLASRHLKLKDWQGERFILAGPTGKSTVVDTLAEVWQVIEQHYGGAFDPLDPNTVVTVVGVSRAKR